MRLVDGRPATWTVVHYGAGDNDLAASIVEDIDEMERGHSGTREVNVVVQLDDPNTGWARYEIVPGSERDLLESPIVGRGPEELDSGDARTLTDFGRWAVQCYPAEHYFLIVAGHGHGWDARQVTDPDFAEERLQQQQAQARGEALRLIAPDHSSASEIYLHELVRALEKIEDATRREGDPSYLNRLTFYGSDACLMQTLEVGYEMRNTAVYHIGSEETEPGQGWPYSTVLRELTDRPLYFAQRPYRLAEEVVDSYGRSYGRGGAATENSNHTLAAVDLAALQRAKTRTSRIGALLDAMLEADPGLAADVWWARHRSFTFGDGYTDLWRFLQLLKERMTESGRMPALGERGFEGDERGRELRDVIRDLEDMWEELVITSRVGSEFEGAGGLSVFFPTDQCGASLDLETYLRSPYAEASDWDEFLLRLLTEHPEGGTVELARGVGVLELTVDGVPLGAYEATCELRGGHLYVGNTAECHEGEGCVDPPRVSLIAEVDGVELEFKNAFVMSPRVRGPGRGEFLEFEVEPGRRYAGSARLEAGRRDVLQLEASFDCAELEVQLCRD